MRPEDLYVYKRAMEQTAADSFRRVAEEQIALAQNVSRQFAESAMIRFPTAENAVQEIIKNIAIQEHQRLKQLMMPSVSSALNETVRKLTKYAVFNPPWTSAANAAAETIKLIHGRNRDMAAQFAHINRRAAAESVASLTSLFADHIKDLEAFETRFTQTVAQTLRFAFEEFENRNKESLAQLQQSINDKIDALPAKMSDPAWMKALQLLGVLVALATFALQCRQFLDSKEDSKNQAALAATMLIAMQQVVRNTEREINTYYVVQRKVRLKEKPDNRAKTLSTIPVGDEVRLIEKKHKWIRVEYVEDSNSSPIYGWANKKYLKRVQ